MPAEWVRARARLHRSIYRPAIGVLLVWGPLLVWAWLAGLDLVAQLALVVVMVGAPLLLGWAWLRARTSFVLLTDQRLIAVNGPVPRRVTSLPLDIIDSVRVRRARLGPAATLYASPFMDAGVEPLEMHDLAQAEAFASKVRAAMGARRP